MIACGEKFLYFGEQFYSVMSDALRKAVRSNTYDTAVMNMDNVKIIQGKFPMQNAEYEQIEVSNNSGIKLCFEFPKSTENGEKILKEVRSILSGELRDTLQKSAG